MLYCQYFAPNSTRHNQLLRCVCVHYLQRVFGRQSWGHTVASDLSCLHTNCGLNMIHFYRFQISRLRCNIFKTQYANPLLAYK